MLDKRPRVLAIDVKTCSIESAVHIQASTYDDSAAEPVEKLRKLALTACRQAIDQSQSNSCEIVLQEETWQNPMQVCNSFYFGFFKKKMSFNLVLGFFF